MANHFPIFRSATEGTSLNGLAGEQDTWWGTFCSHWDFCSIISWVHQISETLRCSPLVHNQFLLGSTFWWSSISLRHWLADNLSLSRGWKARVLEQKITWHMLTARNQAFIQGSYIKNHNKICTLIKNDLNFTDKDLKMTRHPACSRGFGGS